MSSKSFALPDSICRYLVDQGTRDTELLEELRETTRSDAQGRMQISPELGQLLSLLVQAIGARRCIELGTFTGYSSLCIALALPEGGRLVCCDISSEWTATARLFWKRAGVAHKIDLRLAPALDTLDGLIASGESGDYDFAFIDADKQGYLDYYERCLTLLRPGGLIAADNTFLRGLVADPADQSEKTRCMRAFNSRLHDDDRIAIVMLPVGDGLTLALKR